MAKGDERSAATDESEHNKAPDASSKERRANFIRQASLPIIKRNKSQSAKKESAINEEESANQADANESEKTAGPSEQEAEEEDDDDDRPPLHSRWLHALETGKGWTSFSVRDSRRLESAWKTWVVEKGGSVKLPKLPEADGRVQLSEIRGDDSWKELSPDDENPAHRVPVGPDMLYDADFEQLTMSPVFWKGPKLQILRATWFFESNKLAPCSATLAAELESQYQTLRPWLSSYTDELRSSIALGAEAEDKLKCHLTSLKNTYIIFQGPRLARLYTEGFPSRLSKQFFTAWSGEHGGGQMLIRGYQTQYQLTEAKQGYATRPKSRAKDSTASPRKPVTPPRMRTTKGEKLEHQLANALGDEEHEPVIVDDADTFDIRLSDANKEQVQNSASHGDLRGLSSSTSQPLLTIDKTHVNAQADTPKFGRAGATLKHLSLAAASQIPASSIPSNELLRSVASKLGVWAGGDTSKVAVGDGADTLTPQQQQMIDEALKEAQSKMQDVPAPSTDDATATEQDKAMSAEEPNKRQAPTATSFDDPEAFDDQEQAEEDAEHSDKPPELLLAIHGIGQRLAGEWKSFDFTLAVNTFRAMLQTRIDTAKPPAEIGGEGLNGIADKRRLQVVPVLWQAGFLDGEAAEATEAAASQDEDSEDYDNGLELQMDHIFGDDGIPIVRTMVKDVLMDIPMYLSHHKSHVTKSVIREANRQYRLFVKRNPNFEAQGGKVHIIAHSLGTVISADVLSSQPNQVPLVKDQSREEVQKRMQEHLLFNTHNFFALGSPVSIFFVLNRAQLIARSGRVRVSRFAQDKKGVTLDEQGKYGCMAITNFYNIWNQYDPVATRVTPAVDVEYAKQVKPVPLNKAVRSVLRADRYAINSDLADDARSHSLASGNVTESEDGQQRKRSRKSGGFFSSWSAKAGDAAASINQARKSGERPRSSTSTEANTEPDKEAANNIENQRKDKVKDAGEDAEDVRAQLAVKAKQEEANQAEREKKAAKEGKSEMSVKRKERAEARLRALNPMHRVDFYMPVEGYSLLSTINQYTELMTAHMSYWTRTDFADFLITQILSDQQQLERSLDYREVEGWS